MCLTCSKQHNAITGKDIAKLFDWSGVAKGFSKMAGKDVSEEDLKSLSQYNKNILHLANGNKIVLTKENIEEIVNHALAVIATGVDTQIDVWAIQWPNDYKVKTIKL